VKVTIRSSGGLGGFGLDPRALEVVVERLPAELGIRCRAVLAPARLRSLAGASERAPAPDRVSYAITVEEGDRSERVDLDESALPEDVLELLDELRAAGGG
jgi:hypothetical protein